MIKRYINKAGINKELDLPLFRSLYKVKTGHRVKRQGLSASRAREILKDKMKPIVSDISKFSLHSLRAGGASAAANAGVTDRLFKRHGRWLSDRAKDGYVKDNLQERLGVSYSLGI